jgi:DNA gyrase subunit A
MAKSPKNPPRGEIIEDVQIQDEMEDAYVKYAMSVITARALPDVRDGLKPSQRRVLYAMHDLNLTPRASHRKCAKIVGECMGNYHPHGDSPIYGTLARMAQPFATRYMLVDGQGNFGSVQGDNPAAMRYTEARMQPAAMDMMADIKENTVNMAPTFDESTLEPLVLPAKFPNLLCNGSQGIAVGMSTNIPPHNLREICQGICALIKTPEMTDAELFQIVTGPDFPTGGAILGINAIRQAYKKGRGSITMRGTAEVAKDNKSITIVELPFQVMGDDLSEKIRDQASAGKIEGISSVRNNSNKNGIKIVIELKRGEDPEVVRNQLYSFTPLQSTFSINMVALDHGRPRTFTLREILVAYYEHRIEVLRRRTRFRLRKVLERIHILQGLKKALEHIDEIIALIRASADARTASEALQSRFEFTERQAGAILAMQLQRLTGLEKGKIIKELEEKSVEAIDLRDILGRKERINSIIVEDLGDLVDRYGDDRRTIIEEGEVGNFDLEDLIIEEAMVVTMTHEGYVKRIPLATYKAQQRNTKGMLGASTKEGDFVEAVFTSTTHAHLLCFTDQGRIYWLKVYNVPQSSRTSRGRAIVNLLRLKEGEMVSAVIPMHGDFEDGRQVVMATRFGVIKKTNLAAFKNPMKRGIIALKIDEGDCLIGVALTNGKQDILLATSNGQAIRFHEAAVRSMGRTARGVRGIKLSKTDQVCSLVVVDEANEEGQQPTILTLCEKGYGKRTPVNDYRITNRGGKGIINIRASARNGKVVGVKSVDVSDQVIMVTQQNKIMRTNIDNISSMGRATQGVKIISVTAADDVVVAMAKIDSTLDEYEFHDEKENDPEAPTTVVSAKDSDAQAVQGDVEVGDAPENG